MRALILSMTALTSVIAVPVLANGHHNQNGYGQHNAYGAVDPRCESERRTSRNVGGFLGALGGASAGRALAAAAVRPEGVILGTVVGAVIGSKVGSAAVDCTPRPLYTQGHGRSYGVNYNGYPHGQAQQPRHDYSYSNNYNQAPVYHQPNYHQPNQHQPVYQQPVHQQPVYQQPVYQHETYVAHQQNAREDWYQPSPHSFYGQERSGTIVSAPQYSGRSHDVSSQSYAYQHQHNSRVVTQTYHSRGPVYVQQSGQVVHSAPYYAPHHAPQPVMSAPHGTTCGFHICR